MHTTAKNDTRLETNEINEYSQAPKKKRANKRINKNSGNELDHF